MIPDALIADLRAHGGELVVGEAVTEPPGGVVIYDTAPTALLDIYGDAVPPRYAKALRRYRFGPGCGKVDFVLSGEIPWRDARAGRRADRAHGRNPSADGAAPSGRSPRAATPNGRWYWPRCRTSPTRSRIDAQGRRPLWTYAHVPSGSTVDLTETVTEMFERFAPGFRDMVVAARCVPAAQMSEHNANYVGGDISVGGTTLFRAHGRPDDAAEPVDARRFRRHTCARRPRRRARGVHGMAGYYAARTVLRREFGIKSCRSCRHDATDEELSWELIRHRRTMNWPRDVAADGYAPDLILADRARRAVRRRRTRLRAGGEERRI